VKEPFRFLSFLLILGVCAVTAKFVWGKYLQGDKSITIDKAFESTKGDLIGASHLLNQELGKVLGVKTDDLPELAKKKLEESQAVKQIQEQVNEIVNDSVSQAKQLPATEIKKIKKDVAAEICKQLLENNE